MATYRMTIEYDGTNFVGWQMQNNGRSVQEVLEHALCQITQTTYHIVGAGRTDAGVHAFGQVASFQSMNELDTTKILKGLNAVLPEDVVIREFLKTYDNFHARYSAKSRTYRYTIARQPVAIGRLYSWQVYYILNCDELNRCAELIHGTHSFQPFCKKEAEVLHYKCTVEEANWTTNGNFLQCTIRANRFLHGMVRALVGTMIDVARGYISFEKFQQLFENVQENSATFFAPAKGLCLMEVQY
ncbi:MAG: tRNA pseudouridine(38-40) synthase TruA [Bacteroidetes bacterium]|jgi:tRNA pseudouridine38-40 synthase|nr:tRNA pseudouridine(38-40) synthase TruA [Bacteroidota bacterium]